MILKDIIKDLDYWDKNAFDEFIEKNPKGHFYDSSFTSPYVIVHRIYKIY